MAALGLLLFFLFLRQLSQVNTRLLSDVLKGTSATLLALAFILFILSGRVLFAALLLGLVALLLFSYRNAWRKKAPPKLLQLLHPLTVEEACAALDLDIDQPLSLKKIEKAYQKKVKQLKDLKGYSHNQERNHLRYAKDFLIQLKQKMPSPPSDFL